MLLSETVREATEELEDLGHDVVWTVGTQIAHGRCRRCGDTVTLEAARRHVSRRGDAFGRACTGVS